MSAQSRDEAEEFATIGVDARERGRYADITLENGEILIYDRENEDAWIQAEFTIGRDMMM